MPSPSRAVPCARPLVAGRSAGRSPEAGGSLRGVPLFKAIVRPDNARHELVADDVAVVEVDHRDALDVAQDLPRQHQAALLSGEVDLRYVPGDHSLRAEAQTSEEHLHLRGCRVLRLVEDDESLIQASAAHVRQWRDLDLPALRGAGEALRRHELVERVVERAQVGVDLLLQISWQESEPLPRLDGGPGEDQAADFSVSQRRNAHRDSQKALPRAGWTYREHEIVLADRLDVRTLVVRLRR